MSSNNIPYLEILTRPKGSQKKDLIDGLVNFVSGGQFKTRNDLVGKVKKATTVQTKRIDSITELSETNMKLLEKNLIKMEGTLEIYNLTGITITAAATLGSILLALKLKRHSDQSRAMMLANKRGGSAAKYKHRLNYYGVK